MKKDSKYNSQSNLVKIAVLAVLVTTSQGWSSRAAGAAGVPGAEGLQIGMSFLGGVALNTVEDNNAVPSAYRLASDWAVYSPEPMASETPALDMTETASTIAGAFRSVAIPMRNFPVAARWAPVYRAISACQDRCDAEHPEFQALLQQAKDMGFLDKLSWINNGINRMIAYEPDRSIYGTDDYWAKPQEILQRGAGDCEDFAILKMAALVHAGVPARSMSLVVLQDQRLHVFHAVLSINTGSGVFVLDNLRNRVLLDTQLPDYLPLYSFSTNRAWIHGTRSGGAQLAGIRGGFGAIAPGEGFGGGVPEAVN